MIETVRLSQVQRNKLMKVRKQTGIKNWNVLCRWGLCHSLGLETDPPDYVRGGKTGIEMDWVTFTGKDQEYVYSALLSKLGVRSFYGHINRGIDILLERKDSKFL
jgi:DNA sulfur modification protein DndE